MKKKNFSTPVFNTSSDMDDYLETHDLSPFFKKGVVERPHVDLSDVTTRNSDQVEAITIPSARRSD